MQHCGSPNGRMVRRPAEFPRVSRTFAVSMPNQYPAAAPMATMSATKDSVYVPRCKRRIEAGKRLTQTQTALRESANCGVQTDSSWLKTTIRSRAWTAAASWKPGSLPTIPRVPNASRETESTQQDISLWQGYELSADLRKIKASGAIRSLHYCSPFNLVGAALWPDTRVTWSDLYFSS
jgi:hypothetical protein